jgi:predicted porin
VGSTSSSDYVVFAAGIEGQYFANAWTLRGQAGLMDSDDNGNLVQDAGFIDLGADYYASSKLKLSGSLGYLDGATSGTSDPEDVTQWNWVLGAEYLFGKSIPVSTYLEYRGQSQEVTDGGETAEVDTHAVNVGVRFYFGGGGDLMKADREGAGMGSPDIITRSRAEYTP